MANVIQAQIMKDLSHVIQKRNEYRLLTPTLRKNGDNKCVFSINKIEDVYENIQEVPNQDISTPHPDAESRCSQPELYL